MGWYLEGKVAPVSISPGALEVLLEAVSVRESGPRCNYGGCNSALGQCAYDNISFLILRITQTLTVHSLPRYG